MGRDLPAVVTDGELEEGNTVVHRHPAANDIWSLCKLLRTDHTMTPAKVREALLIEWPDLDISVESLDRFLDRYVDAFVVTPPGFYRRGLVRAGINLNAALEVARVAEEMQSNWEESKERVNRVLERDSEGKPTIIGPSDKDHMAMGKMVIEARKAQMDEMARIGMAPERKGGQGNAGLNITVPGGVHVELRSAVGRGFIPMAPQPPQSPPTMDAEFTTDKATESSTSS